jgi:hypothetical protein
MDSETARYDLLALAEGIKRIKEHATPENWALTPPGQWSYAQAVDHFARSMGYVITSFSDAFAKENMAERKAGIRAKLRKFKTFNLKQIRQTHMLEMVEPVETPGREDTIAFLQSNHEVLSDLLAKFPEPRIQSTFVHHPLYGDLTLPEWIRLLRLLFGVYEKRLEHIVRFQPYPKAS